MHVAPQNVDHCWWWPSHAQDIPQMMPQTCPRWGTRHAPDDTPDDAPDMPQTCPRWCPGHPTDVSPDTRHPYPAVPGWTWLYQTLTDCQQLYLDVLGSALVCQDLPFHRLTHTATDWRKYFCIYRLKCSKATCGWDGKGWMEISVSTNCKSTAQQCQ